MLVDSHCHLDFPDFAEELDAIVEAVGRSRPAPTACRSAATVASRPAVRWAPDLGPARIGAPGLGPADRQPGFGRAAGLAAGPCLRDDELVDDPHGRARDMAVAVPRPEGDDGPPVLVPGNPVRLSRVAVGPERRVPWLGEHTDEVLAGELGLTADERTALRADGVIA